MVLPLEARMHAAFHLAYCVSCNQREERVGNNDCSDKKRKFLQCRCQRSYIVTSYVDLVHPVCYWKQELYSKFLVRHIDIWDDLTA